MKDATYKRKANLESTLFFSKNLKRDIKKQVFNVRPLVDPFRVGESKVNNKVKEIADDIKKQEDERKSDTERKAHFKN